MFRLNYRKMIGLDRIPIKGFFETSFVDWPGKLCSVIFFPHCNFRCRYCHNADLVLRSDILENVNYKTISKCLSRLRGWIDGVCVSGGEPTLHFLLPELLSDLKKKGLLTKLDTNGSNPEVIDLLLEKNLVDYVAMDIKSSLDEASYCKITQTPNMLKSVKRSIQLLLKGSVQYEFRLTAVPSYHQPEDIYKVAMELNGATKLRIQNFNPSETIIDPSLQTLKPFSDQEIDMIQQKVDKLISI